MERNSTSLSREGTQAFFLRRDLGGSIQQEREHNQQDLGQQQHHVALFSGESRLRLMRKPISALAWKKRVRLPND